ncbi:FluC/FEX family fluoride channel [Aciditerrimonas ferrireducens]|uniref:FluC/FEX family fluoride channel n=1 Tax=Aciditerrimonas ferrireducens TaxID=667306 RepID=UPI002004D6BE|nr:CrcB family protein [Aciditerrimonas ferrireducens]MCK4176672.1 CrcB family protein [Aciditerrimonas ferrireducens]
MAVGTNVAEGHLRQVASRTSAGRPARARRKRQWATVAVVALGGALGALLRNLLLLAWSTPSGTLPWATLVVNLSGSIVLGFLLGLLLVGFPRARLPRLLIGTGFIGAYTTFSTWMVEEVLLVRSHHLGTAALYLGLSVVGGLVAVLLGLLLSKAALGVERWLADELEARHG